MYEATREDDSTTPLLRASQQGNLSYSQTVQANQDVSIVNDTPRTEHPPEKWNEPPIKAWRLCATFYSFIVVGANDGVYGALIHYLGKYYELDYTAVSVVFLSPFIGYATAALANNSIHERFGQRGIALLGPSLHIIAYLSATRHPPYPVLLAILILAGLGSGLIDASWNAWISAMDKSNQLMGFLHAFWGLGAALAPLTATTLLDKRGWKWYEFYYLMAAAAVIELVTSMLAFRSAKALGSETKPLLDSSGEDSISRDALEHSRTETTRNNPTLESLGLASTWIVSMFLFVYAGVEVTIGGWIFTFLVDLRHTTPFAAGVVTFTYWGGLTAGRVCLGFVTSYLKIQRWSVLAYMLTSIILHLVFCFVTNFYASAIIVTLLGFFLGPLFPEAVISQTNLLPKYLHVAAVGFACALGSAGACVFPFITGAIAKGYGIEVLQPAVLIMLAICLVLWLGFLFHSRRVQQPAI